MTDPNLGITVMPEYIQSEGIETVLNNIQSVARAGSVTTSPYVASLADKGTGHREPSDDSGLGNKRLLDRPLWGRRELWMSAAPSFIPEQSLYDGLAYQPPAPDSLTQDEGPNVGQFIEQAKAHNMEVWLQIQAAIPPCYKVQFGAPLPEDEPLLPDYRPRPGRVDRNACLASANLRQYVRAMVSDLYRNYPQIDGFKFDWPEYPVYHFDSLFFDFNPAMVPFATGLGLDLNALAAAAREFLSDLSSGVLRGKRIITDDFESFLHSLTAAYPVIKELLALRHAVVTDYARFLRDAVDEASNGNCGLFLQSFPPPLNTATGFDSKKIAPYCTAIGVKFYTMHWPLIEADFMNALASRADVSAELAARAISRLLCLSPEISRSPEQIRYPEPDEAHPAPCEAIRTKIRQARQEGGNVPVWGISHGYGPVEDVMRRFRALDGGAVQINRYAYLCDEKLAEIGAR